MPAEKYIEGVLMMEKRLVRTMSMLAAALMVMGIMYMIVGAKETHAVTNGLVRKNGYIYYYKNGKKVKNKSLKVKGRYYYFSAKGRGFYSVMKNKGNRAMAKVIDHVTFKKGMTRKAKMKRCYRYIVKMSYIIGETPDTSVAKWYYPVAKQMADNMGGKCYGYASLTATCAKALGYKVVLHKGKAKNRSAAAMTEHCWVTIGKKVLDASYDSAYWRKIGSPKTPKLKFFFKTYGDIKKKNPDGFKVRYRVIKKYKL